MIVDLFAGPGGWSEGLRMLSPEMHATEIGLEWDAAACATRAAAGHRTIRTDIATYPTAPFVGKVTGLIASPPCQDFSVAGKGAGIDGERGQLVLEVMRWAVALEPEWIACEQVPPVLPIWQDYAAALRAHGYSAWSGILNAADYGVPQTRQRAFLLASRVRPALPPEPTHAKEPAPSLFGPELLPWVTMADALGWGLERPSPTQVGDARLGAGDQGQRERLGAEIRVGFPRLDDTGTSEDGYRERDWRRGDEPAHVLTEKARSWTVNTGRGWKKGGTREDAQVVSADGPAPTLTGKSGGQWHLNPGRTPSQPNRRPYAPSEPAPTLAFGHDSASWCWERPATTVAGDSRCWPPGHKVNADDIARLGAEEAAERYGDRAGSEAVKLTASESLVLQSFRADYPVQGTKTKQFEQIGNAVPPLLAAHVLAAVTGHVFTPAVEGRAA